MNVSTVQARAAAFLRDLGRDSYVTAAELLKVTIPAIILTKILEELGLIVYIDRLLDPVMGLMGLPGELALVWATAILTSPLAAIGVYGALAPSLRLSVADVTVLASIMLIAHSLPVELSITKKAGAGIIPMALIRIIGGLIYGMLLNAVCSFTGIWQDSPIMLFNVGSPEQSIAQWIFGQSFNILKLCAVIFLVLLVMRILKSLGLFRLLEYLLKPLLPLFGMSHRAAPVTVVGMILGIAYGGALIIKETTAGTMDSREVFNSLALMSLSHGLIEDTLVMMALGAKLGGILWGRLLFSLLFIYVMVKILDHLYERKTILSGQKKTIR